MSCYYPNDLIGTYLKCANHNGWHHRSLLFLLKSVSVLLLLLVFLQCVFFVNSGPPKQRPSGRGPPAGMMVPKTTKRPSGTQDDQPSSSEIESTTKPDSEGLNGTQDEQTPSTDIEPTTQPKKKAKRPPPPMKANINRYGKSNPNPRGNTPATAPSSNTATEHQYSQIHLKQPSTFNILVIFDGVGDICSSQGMTHLASERASMLSDLKTKLEARMTSSQNEVVTLLSQQTTNSTVTYSQHWITNTMYIENVDGDLKKQISGIQTVHEVINGFVVGSTTRQVSGNWRDESYKKMYKDFQGGLEMMRVPEAWQVLNGEKGDGITIGILGPHGVHLTHEVIKDSWLGPYGWYDPVNLKPDPDAGSYGSQRHDCFIPALITGSNGTGVAPNAKWLTCNIAYGSFDDILKCAQFIICPTLADGSEPDCSKAPQVIYNLWYLYKSRKHQKDDMATMLVETVLDCWHNAGIIPVFDSLDGVDSPFESPECGDGEWPSSSDRVISVGNVEPNRIVNGRSPRGPGIDGVIKPDVCAPGTFIVDPTVPEENGKPFIRSSTSISGAFVTGAIALLLNKHKELSFIQVKTMLHQSADEVKQYASGYKNCGNTTLKDFPNNLVGYGVLNVEQLVSIEPPNQ